MGDDPDFKDELFEPAAREDAVDDATTIAQLRATSMGLKRLNEILLLFEETDAETRSSAPAIPKAG